MCCFFSCFTMQTSSMARQISVAGLLAAAGVLLRCAAQPCPSRNYPPTEQGDHVTILSSQTSCLAGVLYYAWDVQDQAELYLQVDVLCYNSSDEGSWAIAEPRVNYALDGTDIYPLPAALGSTGLVCDVRGCYKLITEIRTVYTNAVTVNCSEVSSTDSSMAISSMDVLLPSIPITAAVPSNAFIVNISKLLKGAVHSSSFSLHPTGTPFFLQPTSTSFSLHPTETLDASQTTTSKILFVLFLPVVLVTILSLFIIIVAVALRRHYKYKNVLFPKNYILPVTLENTEPRIDLHKKDFVVSEQTLYDPLEPMTHIPHTEIRKCEMCPIDTDLEEQAQQDVEMKRNRDEEMEGVGAEVAMKRQGPYITEEMNTIKTDVIVTTCYVDADCLKKSSKSYTKCYSEASLDALNNTSPYVTAGFISQRVLSDTDDAVVTQLQSSQTFSFSLLPSPPTFPPSLSSSFASPSSIQNLCSSAYIQQELMENAATFVEMNSSLPLDSPPYLTNATIETNKPILPAVSTHCETPPHPMLSGYVPNGCQDDIIDGAEVAWLMYKERHSIPEWSSGMNESGTDPITDGYFKSAAHTHSTDTMHYSTQY